MTVPVRTYTYLPNTLAQSNQVNTNENILYAWANGGIDDSNLNHLVGIYASTITATTANQGKFGTNPASTVGFTFIAPASNLTPLIVSGVTSQSVNIFEVDLTFGGTKAFSIDKNGIANFNGILSALPNSVAITGTGGSVNATINSGSGGTCSITSGAGGAGFAPVNGGLYTNASDAKLKENVAPITGALILLAQLKPSSYDWIEHKQSDLGFIAQDVESVLPQLVRNHENGLKGLVYTGITALNSAAIMEFYAEFKAYVTAHP